MAATEPIRDKKILQDLANYWLKRGVLRNYALIVVGACSFLRPSDLLRLTWDDVYDFERSTFRSHITLTEKKTGKNKKVALNRQAVKALKLYFPHRRGDYIFSNNRKDLAPLSRVQAWRIMRVAIDAIGAVGQIALYSLCKTAGYHAWKEGVSPVILMDIYNHSSYAITRRYLGVAQDDRDEVYLGLALF